MKLNPQFIKHPGSRERLVVIPESQYRVLEQAAMERLASQTEMPDTPPLPRQLLDEIARGENPIRAVRLWRGLTARQLADLAGISASMLSQIERNGKTGSTRTFRTIAGILHVPMDLIFPN
ncbi:MAG: helix-turn-helix domain-containing protein [Rhizobiaceae bacterium]|nr:helix-turn-helix domain-containing protein [Rhizobiaceae bacterium]MCV0408169.1 helix-turn-helix domain-containing protein [Rhizobiaceae bacterium]